MLPGGLTCSALVGDYNIGVVFRAGRCILRYHQLKCDELVKSLSKSFSVNKVRTEICTSVLVTTSKALVTTSVALVTSSLLFLMKFGRFCQFSCTPRIGRGFPCAVGGQTAYVGEAKQWTSVFLELTTLQFSTQKRMEKHMEAKLKRQQRQMGEFSL